MELEQTMSNSDVEVTRHRSVVRFVCHDIPARPGAAGKLLGALADRGINVIHMFNTEHADEVGDLVITVNEAEAPATSEVLDSIREEAGMSSISERGGLAIITFDYEGGTQEERVLFSVGKAFDALMKAKVNVIHFAASLSRVFLVVSDDKAIRASSVLTRALREWPSISHF